MISSETPPPIRLLLVDDHAVMREGLANMLNSYAEFLVIADAGNGVEALDLFRKHQPDVTLLDISMPGVSGIECLRLIRSEFPDARVVMLSSSESERDIVNAFATGASGYLLKTASSEEVARAILEAHRGLRVANPEIERRLVEGASRRTLTARETEVLTLLREGLSNPEIGQRLDVTPRTAKAHVLAIFEKLGVTDRTEAVVRAFELGLLNVEKLELRKVPKRGLFR